MLAQVAKYGSRFLAGKLQSAGGKSYGWSFGVRSNATAAGSDGNVPKGSYGLGRKLLGAVVLLATGAYVGDLYLNDDLDTISERFRTRLTEEERKDRCVTMLYIILLRLDSR
jgi:hypothetical protein